MKTPLVPGLKSHFALVLGGLFLCWFSSAMLAAPSEFGAAKEYQPMPDEFDPVGKAVKQLLQTKDAAGFATNFAVSAQDWQSLVTTNLPAAEAERLKSFAGSAAYGIRRLESDAKALLKRADSLHLNFSDGAFSCQVVSPQHVGNVYFSSPRNGGLTVPFVDKLEIIIVLAASGGQTNQGEFKLAVRGLEKFPQGWRINNSANCIQWTAFPTNLVDEKMQREMAIMEKISAYKGINKQDDPTLLKFGEILVRFIQTGDTNLFVKQALINGDQVWDMFQKRERKGPTRQEIDEEVAKQNQEQLKTAMKALQLMTTAGIDLKGADIQIHEASVERCQSQGGDSSLDDLIGQQFKLAIAVKTKAKAKNGTDLSGDYILAVKNIMKMGGGDWKVMSDLHWEKIPAGVVDDQTAASMQFESYVAEHGTLPIHTVAPEIEFITLDGEKKMKLSELLGKVVVLDFWATWCGPCQEPMAELQKLREGHDDWQNKVVIVPLSIDDSLSIVRNHVEKRGWTNTFNVWAGEGGWHSSPARTFRVNGVPTTYVIDAQGKIVWAGHPAGADFARTINGLLKQ